MEQEPVTEIPEDAALALSALIKQALPLANKLVDEGTPEDRARFRMDVDPYVLHDFQLRVTDLTSERVYRSNRKLPTEDY